MSMQEPQSEMSSSSIVSAPRTYAEVIEGNKGQNARLYASRLPRVAFTSMIAGIISLVFFFLLPWFSYNWTLGPVALLSPSFTGFQVAGSGATAGNTVEVWAFPVLWLVVLVVIAQIALGIFLFINKLLPQWLSLSIRLGFGVTLVLELVFLFVSVYAPFPATKASLAANPSYTTDIAFGSGPAYGLWLAVVVVLIAGIYSIILLSRLPWYWLLAQDEIDRTERRSGERTNLSTGAQSMA